MVETTDVNVYILLSGSTGFTVSRDVCQSYLVTLTKEGSLLGGFPCLFREDRIAWGDNYITHVYSINIKPIVKELNKGVVCLYI